MAREERRTMRVIQQSPLGPVHAPRTAPEDHFVLDNISWEPYHRILQDHGGHRLRHTYDRGLLELMTISFEHGSYSYLLGLLIAVLAEELKLRVKGGDPVTFRREALQRGLEPDKLFYVQSAHLILGRREI